jgi:hypothetical protein
MKRLFLALTLLLMSFLSALDHLERVHGAAASVGVQRWMTELLLAALAVALFARTTSLGRRMLYPRRGARLLTAGIVVYALAVVVASGLLVRAAALLPLEAASALGDLPAFVAAVPPQPLWVAAFVLLVLGAFRALCNLVPPAEFAADY